jgi:hypothetical protein
VGPRILLDGCGENVLFPPVIEDQGCSQLLYRLNHTGLSRISVQNSIYGVDENRTSCRTEE